MMRSNICARAGRCFGSDEPGHPGLVMFTNDQGSHWRSRYERSIADEQRRIGQEPRFVRFEAYGREARLLLFGVVGASMMIASGNVWFVVVGVVLVVSIAIAVVGFLLRAARSFKASKTAAVAIAHPLRFALQSGAAAALAAFVAFVFPFGLGSGTLVAAGAFLVVFVVNVWMWRPGGPAARWYERARSDGA